MVANRALSPLSKLAIEQWMAEEVYLGDEAPLQVQHFYRAMEFFCWSMPRPSKKKCSGPRQAF
jgi:hypothetical protein